MRKLLLRINEAAAAVGLSRSKIYQLIAAGEIPVVRVHRSVRIVATDLEAWVEGLRTSSED